MSEIVEKFDLEETKEITYVDDGGNNNDNDNNGIDAGTNTSPGQLQDVTMDNSYTIGYRSPCHSLQHGSNGSGCGGNTSPGQGRSVREFEEQMTALRKENFNLKLRIYFLEEKIPGYSSSSQNHQDGHETLIKQNVDLKVDIEVLRKELQEKQKLLCEAAKAMDLMEQQQKATEEQSQTIIDELNEKIRYLESENRELEKLPIGQHTLDQLMGRTELGNDIDTVQKIRELEGFIKQYEQKTDELTDKINELETNLNDKNDNINLLEKKIKQLEYHNSELQEQLDIKMKDNLNAETIIKELERKSNQNDNTEQQQQQLAEDYEKLKNFYDQEKLNTEKIMEEMKHQKLKEELIDYKKQLADKICTLEEVDTKLQQKTKEHEKACNAIQKLLKNTRDLQGEIEKLRKLDLSDQHHVLQIKEEQSSDMAASIRQSFSDLTVGTIDDWNAYKTKFEKLLDDKDAEIEKLKLEIKKKTANLQNLVNKELWEKNREIERLTKLLNKAQSHPVSVPNSPTREIDQLQQSFTDSDYTTAIERNKCLQKKVDTLIQRLCAVAEQNPEPLVQQLRMELQEAREETEKANQWRKECTDVCEMLKDRLEELAGFLDSLLEDDTLRALAADKRRAMKKAINRSLEISRSLNNMSLSRSRLSVSGIGEQSLIQLSSISGFLDLENKENRTFNLHQNQNQDLVIIENLKAEIKSLKKELDRKKAIDSGRKERRSLPVSLPVENQSESEAWSEPDRKVSLARIGLEERLLVKSSVSNIKEEQHESTTESGEIDPSRKSKWCKAQKKIAMLEEMISDRDNRILEVQCELVEADNRLKEENLRLIEVNRELEEYKNVNEMLEIEIATFKSQEGYYQEMKYKFEPMKQELEEKERQLETIQNERDNLNIAICKNEMEIKTLKSDIENLKSKYEKRLESAIEQEQQKLMKTQAELNSEWEEKMKQQEDKFRSNLARDWVSRSLYTDLKHELEGVQKRLCEAQNTIEFLQENESELNKQLIDNEKGVRNLKKKLDEATLQASKAALERTKAMNDKLMLESKLNELIKRMEKVEIEKHELTSKLTQVEKSNSLLHKKLTNYIDMTTGNNVSTNANVTTNHTKTRKQSSTGGGSEASQSGYTSEDVPMIHNRHNNNASTTVNNNDGNDNRSLHRHENSSPDLGIESDVGGGSGTGRTSSVDMMSGQRSAIGLLKPINVLSSDEHNNDLDKETLPESSDCDAFVNDTVNNNNTNTINNNSNHNNTTALVTTTTTDTKIVRTGVIHDCVKVEKENEELRRKLKRTKMAFEDTCNKLRSANQRKEQIERDLRQQIEKTQKVLKNVRTNLENELEQQPKKK